MLARVGWTRPAGKPQAPAEISRWLCTACQLVVARIRVKVREEPRSMEPLRLEQEALIKEPAAKRPARSMESRRLEREVTTAAPDRFTESRPTAAVHRSKIDVKGA